MKYLKHIKRFLLEYDYFDGERVVCQCDIIHAETCAVIVFTELRDNPGKSVTNAIEKVVASFKKKFPDYSEAITIFVERYEVRPNDFDHVIIGPETSWRRIHGEFSNKLRELC